MDDILFGSDLEEDENQIADTIQAKIE